MPPNHALESIDAARARDILSAIVTHDGLIICVYDPDADTLSVFDGSMQATHTIPRYRRHLATRSAIHPDDRAKAAELYSGKRRGRVEIRLCRRGETMRYLIQALPFDPEHPAGIRTFILHDITQEKNRERMLEERATRDPLTALFNDSYGRRLVNEYLRDKDPFATCGMIVIDVDYFKYVNDSFGHLFGDRVLMELADLLRSIFDKKDILMRFGGDEFTVLVKDIGHTTLVRKAMQVVSSVRKLKFEGRDYAMTCSAGVCYLPENENGYTFDQLFENADWALYQAKDNGKDQYVFCDHLRRFEQTPDDLAPLDGIEARYLRNDLISTAFEVFEKMSAFPIAIKQLMEIIGRRFHLDRITVIRTDIQERTTGRQYQWTSPFAPEVLEQRASFSKEDFVTLFHSYDEYQTCVLQADNMSMYSPQAAALLMQGGAQTVLYAAMYCEGRYTGAISYVSCRERRYWNRQDRKELGEVTRIISAHLARTLAANGPQRNPLDTVEYDSLTGLVSFSRFRSDLERLIIGGFMTSGYLLYLDLVGFKYFNQRYGYTRGDRFLKELCTFVIGELGDMEGVLFARIVSDQFLLLLPHTGEHDEVQARLEGLCRKFSALEADELEGYRPQLRIGVYQIEPDCVGASFAIDAANYARQRAAVTAGGAMGPVRFYDGELRRKRALEGTIFNDINEALRERRFTICLQPKISLTEGTVVGAEALVRWRTKGGSLLTPDQFVPLCESVGLIKQLDFYVLDCVAEFLAKNERLGRRQVPISVNTSILHATDPDTAQRYRDILGAHGVDPRLVEIELTETATIEEYQEARRLFSELRELGMRTAIDDFGAGYSIFNSIISIPVDTMKLDRLFVEHCTTGEREIFFLQRIVEIIRGLGYRVVCEGVETQQQAEILRQAGCEEAQGFLFAKPLSIEDYEAFVYPDEKAPTA